LRLLYRHEDLIEIFDDIRPFNMNRDMKYLKKKHISSDQVMQEIEAELNNRNYDVVYERLFCNHPEDEVVLVKLRIKNPQNHRGESSGFRIIAIVNECENYAIIFNIYFKSGSKRKDDMTLEEKAKAKSLYFEHSQE
jgi:mRNA-degrading endonuclease RelE of RelBE toxin-antitoxin system